MDFSQGHPFQSPPAPTFSLLQQCLRRSSASWRHTSPLSFSGVYLATGDPLWGVADRLQPRHGQTVAKESVEVRRDDLWLFPQAVLKLVWDSHGPSLGSKLILAALGCSRTSRKESTGASPALPGSLRRLILLQLRLAWGLAPVTSV